MDLIICPCSNVWMQPAPSLNLGLSENRVPQGMMANHHCPYQTAHKWMVKVDQLYIPIIYLYIYLSS